MKKRKIYLGLMCCAMSGLLLTHSPVQAGFEWRGMSPSADMGNDMPAPIGVGPTTLAAPVAPVTKIGQVTTTVAGDAPMNMIPQNESNAGSYRGFGRDIPLSMAVKQIVPNTMTVEFDSAHNINMNSPVSWTGDGSWQSTLDKVLNKQGLTFDVRGNAVYVSRQMGYSSAPMPVKTLSSSPEMVVSMPITQPAPVAMPVPVRNVPVSNFQPDWSAGANDTLRQTLERWALQNGTVLRWTIDYDYRLKKPVSFEGSFTDAVESLLDEFRTVEPRPYGELKPNAGGGHMLMIRAYGVN